MRFGTSSPTTMLRYDTMSVMTTGAKPGAITESHPMLKPDSHWRQRIGEVRGGSRGGEEPDERDGHLDGGQELPESAARSSARWALYSPSSASCCSSTWRAFTNAISDIEK